MPISNCGPENLSTPTFPNISLTKKLQIYLLFWKSLENCWNNLYFHLYTFHMSYKSFSYLLFLISCFLQKAKH